MQKRSARNRLYATICLMSVLSGCGPQLSVVKDYTIPVGVIQPVELAAVDREQVIQVSVSSPEVSIHVHVYLKEDEEAVERMITLGKPAEKLLAVSENTNEATLNASIPAGKEAVVTLRPAESKEANVHLEITN